MPQVNEFSWLLLSLKSLLFIFLFIIMTNSFFSCVKFSPKSILWFKYNLFLN